MKNISQLSGAGFVSIWLGLASVNASAQTYSVLHNFTNNPDGANVYAGLILSGDTLYGTTINGGSTTNSGTVFKVNTDGSGFSIIHIFSGSDGDVPSGNLALLGNTLYGTSVNGGIFGFGTVFKVNTDGTGFTNLYSFGSDDGANPYAGLLSSGSTLYGTTSAGGSNGSGSGTVFQINTNGTGFTSLYSFSGSDGARPRAVLVLSGSSLYGTTVGGGNSGRGTVFRINTDGSGFTNLYSFTGGSGGSSPEAGLVLSRGVLYGTTFSSGGSNDGTVFKINADGSGFTNLYSFTGGNDGSGPHAGLVLSASALYGTASSGGNSNRGTVFQLGIDGAGFTNLHSFTGSDGDSPYAGLVLSRTNLYGTTLSGGLSSYGTVFKVTLGPPLLRVQAFANQVVLSWGNDVFSLQAAPVVTGVYTNIPGATSPYTNAVTGPRTFFRLQSN